MVAAGRGDAVDAGAGASSSGSALARRAAVRRAGADAVAVELRGAAGGPGCARRAALEPGLDGGDGGGRRGARRRGSCSPTRGRCSVELGSRQVGRQGHQRARRPDRAAAWSCSRDRPVHGLGLGPLFEGQFRSRSGSPASARSAPRTRSPSRGRRAGGRSGCSCTWGWWCARLLRLLRGGARASPARAAIAAAFAALVLPHVLYAAFLEDPLAWALLAVGTALAWRERPAPSATRRAAAGRVASRRLDFGSPCHRQVVGVLDHVGTWRRRGCRRQRPCSSGAC